MNLMIHVNQLCLKEYSQWLPNSSTKQSSLHFHNFLNQFVIPNHLTIVGLM